MRANLAGFKGKMPTFARSDRLMTKWKTVRVREELVNAVKSTIETGQYQSLSEFVSEAVQQRLKELSRGDSLAEKTVEYPIVQERLLCSANHMWALVTPEGSIRVGLSEFAKRRLKGMLGVRTEPVGREVSREKPFGFVETWMFKFDLYAPVSGKIAKTNETLKEDPATISEDPYEAGWIAEIKPENPITLEEELRDLMNPREYKIWAIKQRHFAEPKT
jgi:glycine cleavage system H protein